MTAVPSSLNLRDLDATRAVRRRRARRAAPPTVVYLGTLLRERQLDFIVRAHALVVAEIPDAQLEFVGSGWMPDDEQLLRREAERLGIADNVTITGWLPMPEAWQHVRRAALCVSPYLPVPILRSTSPTKLIEYMALGKPVVANDHPEQADVLRQSGAGLVCGWNEQEFAAAIVELLKDPARCAQMGAAGRRYVAEHRTHWAMVELVAGRYRQHLTEPPKPPKPRFSRASRREAPTMHGARHRTVPSDPGRRIPRSSRAACCTRTSILIPELLSGIAMLVVLVRLMNGTRVALDWRYGLFLLVLLFTIAFGYAVQDVPTGAMLAGARSYLKFLPFFLLPAVHRFTPRQLHVQLMLLLVLALAADAARVLSALRRVRRATCTRATRCAAR